MKAVIEMRSVLRYGLFSFMQKNNMQNQIKMPQTDFLPFRRQARQIKKRKLSFLP